MTTYPVEPELESANGEAWDGEPEAGQLGIQEVECGSAHWAMRYDYEDCRIVCSCGAVR